MSYTNETTHYAIPLPLGSDKTTPMDYNQSAQEVDTVLFEAKTDSASALQKANQLQQDLSTTNDNVTGVTVRVTTLEGTSVTQGQAILQNTQDIADVRADALDMIAAKDEGTAQVATVAVSKGEYFRYNDVLYIATDAIAVGDTIVPNTNCRATNVGAELNQLNNDLTDLTKNDLGTKSNITIDTTSTVLFTAPSDGYLSLVINAGGECVLRIFGANNATPEMSWGDHTDSTHFTVLNLFIKKGMRVRGITNTGTNTLGFYPLV